MTEAPCRSSEPKSVRRFVIDFIDDHGFSPTISEIKDGTGKSVVHVAAALDTLDEAGIIRRDPAKLRGIAIVRQDGAADAAPPFTAAQEATIEDMIRQYCQPYDRLLDGLTALRAAARVATESAWSQGDRFIRGGQRQGSLS